MKAEKCLLNQKNILRAVLAVKVLAVAIKVGATVYSLIPKYDKIKDVDTDSLAESLTPKEATPDELAVEKQMLSQLGAAE